MKSLPQPTPRKQLIIIFLTYTIFASIFGLAYRFAMNPDGITLLRLAGYIAEGNFQQSVSRAWSPLMSWFVSPFIFLGFEGLTAARIVLALWGSVLLLSTWFMALRFDLSENTRLITGLIASLLISFWTIQFIAGDVLFAALIICYVYLVTDSGTLKNYKIPFFCGIAGGFSYLAHHYAFPFFLAHFPAILFLRGYMARNKNGFPLKRIFMSWGVGIIGFLMIASVWVGIVSVRYGNFTISSKGPIARAAVGPKHKGHPFFAGGLYKPKYAYAMHIYEDPSEVKFHTWSPFDSRENFKYQLVLMKDNIVYILNHFVKQSPFFTYAFVLGILAFIPITFLLNKLNDKKKYLYSWVIITFSIYCSGFILIVARSPRRFYALMLIFLVLSFHFLEELKNSVSDFISDKRKKILTFYLLIIVVSAFALKPGTHFLKSLHTVITVDQVNPYRGIAEQIKAVDFPSPYAIIRSAQKPHTDYYLAYFINKQLLGRPMSADVDGFTEELKAAEAKSLMVFDNPGIVNKLRKDKRYVHAGALLLENNNNYLNPLNTKIDQIKGWDKEVNIFTLK